VKRLPRKRPHRSVSIERNRGERPSAGPGLNSSLSARSTSGAWCLSAPGHHQRRNWRRSCADQHQAAPTSVVAPPEAFFQGAGSMFYALLSTSRGPLGPASEQQGAVGHQVLAEVAGVKPDPCPFDSTRCGLRDYGNRPPITWGPAPQYPAPSTPGQGAVGSQAIDILQGPCRATEWLSGVRGGCASARRQAQHRAWVR